jgi:Zn-dependent protease
MHLITLLKEDPISFLLLVVPLLYSIIFHELAHGWVAYKMGDSTAKWLGRLSLNPIRHLDPIGTAALFLVGFGWAKPVPVNFANLHDQKKGLIFVSAAGVTANIILAFLSFFLLRLISPISSDRIFTLLYNMGNINIMLAAFNLIPIPPLDGSKILMGFSSGRLRYTLESLEPYGMFIILGLLWIGALNPVIYFFRQIIIGIIRLFLP